MSEEIFFLIGYPILILFSWLFPFLRRLFLQHKPELLGFSAGYYFLLADIKSEKSELVAFGKCWEEINNYLVVIGVIFGVIGILLSAYEKSKLKKLHETLELLNQANEKLKAIRNEYYKLCSDNLKSIFSSFFDETSGNGRVSLYKHTGHNFILLGRYSQNPTYNKIGRGGYPDNEGFIAKGWEDGEFEINDIPMWKGAGTQYKSYVKSKCNISDEVLQNINMRSKSFYIYRFNNHDASNPLGIIVFEKIEANGISKNTVKGIINAQNNQIKFLLKTMKSLISDFN